MPYPLIFACNGDVFARVNPDSSWSIRWDRVVDIAYTRPDAKQKAICAYARLLYAAKDNFFTTPWDESERLSDRWEHYEAVIDRTSVDPQPDQLVSVISRNLNLIARVNFDGTWSVRWNEVLDIARWQNFDYQATALVAICRLMQAAKDRFVTSPWDEPEEIEF